MNSTISRIVLAAPVSVVILGLGMGAAEAAPMEVSDHSAVQPQPDWNDVIDDFDNGDPDDGPDEAPADPPAEEPSDEPAEEPEDEGEESSDEASEEESDDEANDGDAAKPAKSVPAYDKASDGSKDEDAADATVDTLQVTASELTPNRSAAGVHVPVPALASGGAMIAVVAGWAAFRRHRLLAD